MTGPPKIYHPNTKPQKVSAWMSRVMECHSQVVLPLLSFFPVSNSPFNSPIKSLQSNFGCDKKAKNQVVTGVFCVLVQKLRWVLFNVLLLKTGFER